MGLSAAVKGPRQKNQRRAAPYNAYVAAARQEKYYDRKKTLSKFQRLQRYEEKQQQSAADGTVGGQTFLDKLLAEGAESLSGDYERQLEQSFATSGADDAPATRQTNLDLITMMNNSTAPKRKKRKASAPSGDDESVRKKKKRKASILKRDATTVEATPADVERSRSRRKKVGQTEETKHEASPDDSAKLDKKVRPLKYQVAGSSGVSGSARGSGRGRGRGGRGYGNQVPVRYSKELKEYQRKKSEAEAEQQKKLDEQWERNRRKRDTAKERAIKGQRLSQVNSRGQPKMQTILQELTAKLTGGSASRR